MSLKKMILGATALTLLVSCGNSKSPFAEDTTIREYPTMVLAKQDATLNSVYPATIKGQEDIEIRPRIDGYIEAIFVDEGTVVKKGQSLFKINSPISEQNLRTTQAAVASAEASLKTAEINVNKTKPLAEKGIVSNYQLDLVQNTYAVAKAGLDQARAAYANAQASMSWTNVTSPVNGVVGSIPFRLGSFVNNSYVLTTIANTGNVFASFSLNEKDLMSFLNNTKGATQAEKIKNAPALTLILADGTEYAEKGKIETINGIVNTKTGSANFRAVFPNPQGILRSGSSGKVLLPNHQTDVFVIPQKATFAQQDKILAYKVEGDTITKQVHIEVLDMPDGKSYVVKSGLSVGDKIVIDGLATLKDGKRIKVK